MPRDWLHPTSLHIFHDYWRKYFRKRGFYRRYAKRIGLEGSEDVLEFGSGSGALSLHLAGRLPAGGVLTCVDLSPAWMEIAKKRLAKFHNIEYRAGDIRSLDIPAASFDAVVIHYMLHDVEKGFRPGVVEAVADKLKFGGKLYIREPSKTSHGMSSTDIRRLMTDNGLREVSAVQTKKYFEAVYEK